MNVLQEVTVKEAVTILQKHGSKLGENALRAALKANVYDFGKYIPADGHYMLQDYYVVYMGPLMRFIEAYSHEVPTPKKTEVFLDFLKQQEENKNECQ